jgi:hypothetical protein
MPSLRQRSSKCAFAVLLGIFTVSCSSSEQLHPAEGKLLYKGEPLGGALLTFHPKGVDDVTLIRPTALTRPDGTFTVTTNDKNGAKAGDYIVTVICSELPPEAKKGLSTGGVDAVDKLKGAYANRDNSQINVTIKSGPNQLEPIDLK